MTSLERHPSVLGAYPWVAAFNEKARGRWMSDSFRALRKKGAGVLFGLVVVGEARLAVVAGAGRMAPRVARQGAAEHVQHFYGTCRAVASGGASTSMCCRRLGRRYRS